MEFQSRSLIYDRSLKRASKNGPKYKNMDPLREKRVTHNSDTCNYIPADLKSVVQFEAAGALRQ